MSRLGATPRGDGTCDFEVWAPRASRVEVVFPDDDRAIRLERGARGYHAGSIARVPPGTAYLFRLDGGEPRPDPASRLQRDTVHGPSIVVDPSAFRWTDGGFGGVALADLVLYELHVGAFTEEGTFDAAIGDLDRLRELGITAVELMPVAQFPGARNWGYDGALPFAVQNTYGGPEGLRRFVDAAHARSLAVVLDVVHNHLGPEGNYLSEFGPYFTDRYRNPWGAALNFDGRGSDEVRRHFLDSATAWVEDFHVDALRLDAIQGIVDPSARPYLAELTTTLRGLDRPVLAIAESDLNDPRTVTPVSSGGLGFDAQWSDDFHHALHVLLTGERAGYYADFRGIEDFVKAWNHGFVVDGRRSEFRGRRHGAPATAVDPRRLVVYAQNHDQVGNRARGDRLSSLVPLEAAKLAAAATLLSPATPLLFMGEEWGEGAPFLYFVDHGDSSLVEAVRRGRKEEFAAFGWEDDLPDPQAEATFLRSKLTRREVPELVSWHRDLLAARRRLPRLLARAEGERVLLTGPGVGGRLDFGDPSPDPPSAGRRLLSSERCSLWVEDA